MKKKTEEAMITAHVETVGFLVLRDGVPCKLVNVSGGHRGGVLLPGEPALMVLKRRDAERMITRTQRVRHHMTTSLVSEWVKEQMPSFVAGEAFTVLPVGRQV